MKLTFEILLIIIGIGLGSGALAALFLRKSPHKPSLMTCLFAGVAGAFFSVSCFYLLQENKLLLAVMSALPGSMIVLWCLHYFTKQYNERKKK